MNHTTIKYLLTTLLFSFLLSGCGLSNDPNRYAPDFFYLGEWTYNPTDFGLEGFMDIREDQFISLLPSHDEVGQYLGCYDQTIYDVLEFEPFFMKIRFEEDENNYEELSIDFLYAEAFITADVEFIEAVDGEERYDKQKGPIFRIAAIPEEIMICGETPESG